MIQDESIRLKARNVWKIFSSQENLDLPKKLSGLSKAEVQSKYNSVVALQDVSFDVKDGETFVVMGLSGSGKSTLVRCINRLIEPTTGSIFVDDENILDYSEEDLIKFRRKKTSMVFQQFGLLPHRNVLENAAWGLEVQDVPFEEREERAMEVLGLVGLNGWEFYMPSALSGGMQQRVGLARAVASDPEILLMDEPFSALDPLIRRDMQQELIRLQEQMQKTTIFITHDMSEAVKLGTRIAIMREGVIIQTGTPEEIIGNPVDSYVVEFTRDVRPSTVLTVGYVLEHQADQNSGSKTSGANVEVSAKQTVEEALSQQWSTSEPLSVINDSGNFVGVIDREKLLQVAFDLPALNNGYGVTYKPSENINNDESDTEIISEETTFQGSNAHSKVPSRWLQVLPRPLTSLTKWVWIGLVLIIGGIIPFGAIGEVPEVLQTGNSVSKGINVIVDWLVVHGDPIFSVINIVLLRYLLVPLENWLLSLPWWMMMSIVSVLAYRQVGLAFTLVAVVMMFLVVLLGIYDMSMTTLALLIVATLLSVVLGVPSGVLAARSDRYNAFQRPILDMMQTMPSFVYLIPVLMLFGLGKVPAIIATVIYAVPPIIRLTNLGIRQVNVNIVEAAQSFGTTYNQLLFKVQIPLAMPTVMAGLNQTIMMALAMVVIAAIIGSKGLGVEVLNGIARLDVGRGVIGGIGIVVMAIILDRITQGLAKTRQQIPTSD
ncbi:MAG: hypothetical protein CL785_00520 [Chloroflexi bacterium]|nr:hypothetical protein [Chloroflexota bacterium]|tara:strand:+ start:8728 stop:10872 length:2145 start_codon:yes stop_codon:yes gene_type:complete